MTGTKDKRFARIEIDGFPAPAQPTQAAPLPPTVVPVADPVARVQGDRAVIERIAGRKVADTVYAEGEAVIDLGVDNARKARAAFDKLPLFTEACSGLVNRIVSEHRIDSKVYPGDLRFEQSADSDALVCSAPNMGWHRVSDLAFGQVTDIVGASLGTRYLKSLPPDWQAQNLQRHADVMPGDSKLVVLRTRTLGNAREIYAGVSESYTPIDGDVLATIAAGHAPANARGSFEYDQEGARGWLDLKLFTNVRAENFAVGEAFECGVRFSFNDRAGGAITGRVWFLRNLCKNLIILDRTEVVMPAIRHVGNRTARLADVHDLVRRTLSVDAGIGEFVKRWGYAAQPAKPAQVLARRQLQKETLDFEFCNANQRVAGFYNGLATVGQLQPGQVSGCVDAYWRDAEATGTDQSYVSVRGLVNGLTRYAHEGDMSRWSGESLERLAGELTWEPERAVAFNYVLGAGL